MFTRSHNSLMRSGIMESWMRWRSYEPLPSVFPGPWHLELAGGEPPPWPPLGFVLVSSTGITNITSKFTSIFTNITSEFTNILGLVGL